MSTFRESPYGTFRFLVSFGGGQGWEEIGQIVGGFSEASGLTMDAKYSDYRNGNGRATEVTLKRGLVGARDCIHWLDAVRDGSAGSRQVQITVLDAARNPVVAFVLRNALPRGYIRPALATIAGSEVPMDELLLVHEGIEHVKLPI